MAGKKGNRPMRGNNDLVFGMYLRFHLTPYFEVPGHLNSKYVPTRERRDGKG